MVKKNVYNQQLSMTTIKIFFSILSIGFFLFFIIYNSALENENFFSFNLNKNTKYINIHLDTWPKTIRYLILTYIQSFLFLICVCANQVLIGRDWALRDC